jgi:signal transduction histidine kinase
LIQLVLIFLDNALKYTPTGGEIKIITTQENDSILLEIADTGTGIPAEDLPRIWDRFYKVDKAHTRDDHGTGLGLAIAREIIERHNAQVNLSSELGRGTRVCLRFPAAK